MSFYFNKFAETFANTIERYLTSQRTSNQVMIINVCYLSAKMQIR